MEDCGIGKKIRICSTINYGGGRDEEVYIII